MERQNGQARDGSEQSQVGMGVILLANHVCSVALSYWGTNRSTRLNQAIGQIETCQTREEKIDPAGATGGEEEAMAGAGEEDTVEAEGVEEAMAAAEEDMGAEVVEKEALNAIGVPYRSKRVKRWMLQLIPLGDEEMESPASTIS